MFRYWLTGYAVCALLISCCTFSSWVPPLAAGEQVIAQGKEPQVLEGVVISSGSGQVSMRAGDGKEHVFKIGEMTRINVNGKPGKLADLKPGLAIRAMVDEAGKVISISTIDDRKSGP